MPPNQNPEQIARDAIDAQLRRAVAAALAGMNRLAVMESGQKSYLAASVEM